ncbi:hypothetical protein ACSYGO_46250 [Streptomyces krungchingensis]
MNTPTRARTFFDDVQDPVKEFALIEDVGHFAAYKRPELLLDFLLTRVLPTLPSTR